MSKMIEFREIFILHVKKKEQTGVAQPAVYLDGVASYCYWLPEPVLGPPDVWWNWQYGGAQGMVERGRGISQPRKFSS